MRVVCAGGGWGGGDGGKVVQSLDRNGGAREEACFGSRGLGMCEGGGVSNEWGAVANGNDGNVCWGGPKVEGRRERHRERRGGELGPG